MRAGKLLTLLISAAVVLGGCGKKQEDKKDTYVVGVCQLASHVALDAATEGFVEALKEKLGDKVTFDIRVSDGSAENCETIATEFAKNKVDLIMANATAALQQCAKATSVIPVVATSITDYGTALGIRKWSGITGINVTGTSDMAPIEEQENMILEILGKPKKIGIVYCSLESNSLYQATCMEKELENDKIAYESYTVRDAGEIEAVVREAVKSCDAIYIPTDNTMASSMELLKKIFLESRIPMFAGEEGLCAAGIATLSIDYHNLGYNAGMMAYEILVNNAEAGLMEIGHADTVTKKYNVQNANELGIKIPDDYIPLSS